MFADRMFTACFPTGVWMMMREEARAFNAELISTIRDSQATQEWLRNQTVHDPGYSQQSQSLDNLHQREDFQAFNEMALEAARSVLDYMKYQYDSCYITGCWANISNIGEGHRSHIHPNNFLSGVYYAQAPQGCGEIVFDDPRQQVKVLIPSSTEQTLLNSHEYRVQPKTGMLVMFPSWLAHRVTVSKCTDERISVAFNVMLRGRMGFSMASADL